MGLLTGGLPEFPWDTLTPFAQRARAYPGGMIDLSVGTPVQVALPSLLTVGASIRAAIQQRTRRNLERIRDAVGRHSACELLNTEGGWSAVLRVPAIRSEERLVLELLDRERILVHPGYFFDFAHEAYIVVSLLPREDMFADAIERTLAFAAMPGR